MPEPGSVGYSSSVVLVADDNEVAQRLCRRVLEKAGYMVLIAGDGQQEMRVVIASAHSMASDRERFLAAGADDVLSKPFRLGDLVAVVARLTAKPSA
jgi:CheY-like chemotaxis protein